jgi:hypothetical protein
METSMSLSAKSFAFAEAHLLKLRLGQADRFETFAELVVVWRGQPPSSKQLAATQPIAPPTHSGGVRH